MATTPKKTDVTDVTETGVLRAEPTAAAAEHGDHDRIVMASRRADGSMDQHRPEFIGDKETAVKAAQIQLGQQAASAVDAAARAVPGTPQSGEGSSAPDAEIAALKAAQDKAVDTAEAQAEREVNELHQGEEHRG